MDAQGENPDRIYEIAEFQRRAELRMPEPYLAYVDCHGGGQSMRNDADGWRQLRLRSRALVDVSMRSTETTVLGQSVSMPVLVAPFVGSALVHPEAEGAIAGGSAEAGTLMTLSMFATRSPEEIGAVAGRFWQQLYWLRDRAILQDVVQRAERSGATALCLTVDLPVAPHFPPPMRQAAAVVAQLAGEGETAAFMTRYNLVVGDGSFIDASITWDDLAWLAQISKLPLVLKGIMRPDDADLACQHGVAGIVVSNHGGHGLDYSIAAADALSEIVNAVAGRIEVYVDGQIRSGSDVLRALALGARATLIGRPALWGVTVDGAAGVERVLTILRDELQTAMAITGAARVQDIDRSILAPVTGC